jgi:glycosyltransferase involved in cell wall biosynthesis
MDGISTDNTIGIAQSYRDGRIKISSEKDEGIYDALNKGIKLAKGDWIYFLGSDDKLFNSYVLQQVKDEVSNNNYDVIYGDVYSTRFNGRYAGEFNNLKIMSQNICHQAIFFKKTVFKKTRLFDLRYKSHADWDHNMHWFLSPIISKMYFNCIIAEYADGGYSSLTGDPKFGNERIFKYLLYGKTQLTTSFRINLLIQELKRTVKTNNKYLFLKLLLHIPRIITGV